MTGMATEQPRIGDQIRRARQRKRWTQRQLADRVGVDRKTIDNWENDRSYPRNRVGALEEVLGITLGGEPPSQQLPTIEQVRARLRRIEQDLADVRSDLEESPPDENESFHRRHA